MSFKFLIFELNQTNTTSPNITDNPTEEPTANKYLWLLVFDLLIFISLTITTYTSSKKLNSEQENPDDFRPKFIKWLVLANGVRALSLIFILAFGNPNGNNATSWLNSIFHPSRLPPAVDGRRWYRFQIHPNSNSCQTWR